jgi:Tfp pilus assembly protein PilF
VSVIGNALKAAQKEKQRRSGTGGPPPLIVPLKGRPTQGGFSWQRALLLAVGGGVLFGATAVGVNLMKRKAQLAPLPAPVILGEATPSAAPDSATRPFDAAPRRVATASPVRPAAKSREVPAKAAPRAAPAAAASQTTPTQQGLTDSGRAALRVAVETPREDAWRLFRAAVAAHRSGDLGYARTAYERVLVMVPNDVDAMNNLGLLLSSQREYARAEQLLRHASTLAPRNANIWNNLGTVLRERGQSADAIAAFQHALAIDPVNQAARVSLAQQYLAIGSLPKARELLEQVVAGNPASPEALYTLGQVLEQQGERAGAVRAYEAFVAVAPGRFATHVEFVRQRIRALRTP